MYSKTLTFNKGMNTDIDKSLRDGSSYLMAENFTFTSTDGGTSGALENTKGNDLISNISFATNHELVGYTSVLDKIIFFTTDGTDSNIYSYTESTGSVLIYSDAASTAKLNFSLDSEYRIVAIGRKELEGLEKVYWVDGINELRYIDLSKDYTGKEASIFNVIPPTDLTADLTTTALPGSGNYEAGTVYHSYQFYTTNGASSTISSVSHPVRLSEYTALKDGGNEQGETSSCSVEVKIENIDSSILDTYNRIRIYAIHYTNTSNPVVNIVAERNLISTEITIIDTGNTIGTIELDQYLNYNQTSYIPNAITSQTNTLLIGNIKENTFSSTAIDDWDARAYRFYQAQAHATITEASNKSNYITIADGTGTHPVFTIEATNIAGLSPGDAIPDDFDCANEYNDIYTYSLYDRTLTTGGLRYQSDHTTLGGEGINVEYEFVDRGKIIDTGNDATTIASNSPVKSNQSGTYTDLAGSVELDMAECQDGEVYRVGIKFYNNKGQSSFVKWVGDILWEEHYDRGYGGLGLTSNYSAANPNDNTPNFMGYKVSRYGLTATDDDKSTSRAKVLKVTIKNFPADSNITAWQVVRAKRSNSDRSVVANGALIQTYTDTTDLVERPQLFRFLDNYDNTKTLFKFISPELQFNNPSELNLSSYKFRVLSKISDLIYSSVNFGNATFPQNSYIYKFTELKGLSNDTPPTDNYIGINDFKWVTPQYKQDGLSDPSVQVGGYTYVNEQRRTDSYSAGASGFVVDLDSAPSISTADGLSLPYELLYASLIKNSDSTRYGGIAYQDILNTEYIPFSKVMSISNTEAYCYNGDVITTPYYSMEGYWYDSPSYSQEGFQSFFSFPVQSTIDLRRRQDRLLDYYIGTGSLQYDMDVSNTMFIAETVGKGIELFDTAYDTTIGDLFRYNPVYSVESGFEKSFPKPFDFIESKHSPTKIIASEKKINGEPEDQWTNFLANNFIEVDTAYGDLNDLKTVDSKVFYWQDKGFGRLAVNERSLISDSAGAQLSLGTGGVLERYDYISTEIGNVDKYSITKSENSLFWVYSPKNKIYGFDSQLKELSTSAGISTYLINKEPIIDPVSTVDFLSNETLFKINDEVLVYDWFTGTFTGVYTFVPKWLMPMYNGNYMSTPDGIDIYLHNSNALGRRVAYYGTVYDSMIKHICAQNYTATKAFDTLDWHSTCEVPSQIPDDAPYETEIYSSTTKSAWQYLPVIRYNFTGLVDELNYNLLYKSGTIDPSNNADYFRVEINGLHAVAQPFSFSSSWSSARDGFTEAQVTPTTYLEIMLQENITNGYMGIGSTLELRDVEFTDKYGNQIVPDSITEYADFSYTYTSVPAIPNGTAVADITFNRYRIYNDYQNTDWQEINWERDERGFTTIIPRNRFKYNVSQNADIFESTNLDETRLYKERIRDRYMVLDLEFDNGIANGYGSKFYVPYINVNYRQSIR